MSERTAADILVECLKRRGITFASGIPGGHIIGVFDALRRTPEIRYVTVRHEQAAGFLADGYARVTGRPALCITTAGPGLTNAATPLANAFSDSIPLLMVTGQVETGMMGRGAFHDMDQLSFTAPITRWNTRIERARDVPAIVERAFREMMSGRPGPVHLEVPHDVQKQKADVEIPPPTMPERPAPDAGDVTRAAEILRQAERPVIFVGGGAVSSEAADEVAELSRLLGAAVFTTLSAKGLIPEDQPLAGGVAARPACKDLVARADAALAVGCRFTEIAFQSWTVPVPEKLVHVDIDPSEIGKNYPAAVGIAADAKPTLQALIEGLRGCASRADQWVGPIRAMRQAFERNDAPDAIITRQIREMVDRDAILMFDVCRFGYHPLINMPAYMPRSVHYSPSFVAMGFALPSAIAAKLAFPERQVVSIGADGGFMMTAQELATVVQLGLKIPIVVFSDNAFTSIKLIQEAAFDGHSYGTDLVNPDFVQLAGSFGIEAARVDDWRQFPSAFRRALDADGPYLLEVVQTF